MIRSAYFLVRPFIASAYKKASKRRRVGYLERLEDAKAFVNEGFRTGQCGNHFTIGPMKMLQDGALGARTAAMNEPYEGFPEISEISRP